MYSVHGVIQINQKRLLFQFSALPLNALFTILLVKSMKIYTYFYFPKSKRDKTSKIESVPILLFHVCMCVCDILIYILFKIMKWKIKKIDKNLNMEERYNEFVFVQ